MADGWLQCPANIEHTVAGLARHLHLLGHGYDEERANQAIIRCLVEGHCPACPDRRLTTEQVTLMSQPRDCARCPCCGGLWGVTQSADGAEWELLDRGCLVEA